MSTTNLEDSIRAYLQKRQNVIRSVPQDQTASLKTFSFEAPHRCSYCAEIVLDGCAYNAGETSFNLKTSVSEAIEACEDGCHFFQWLVDICSHCYRSYSDTTYSDCHLLLDLPTLPLKSGFSWLTGLFLIYPDDKKVLISSALFEWDIYFCTTSDNPAAEYITARPHELDTESDKTVKLAKNCLAECIKSHEMCAMDPSMPNSETEALSKEDLPSRLLEISGSVAKSVRLLELSKLQSADLDTIANSGYVTLSYCWGGDQPVKLTKDSAQSLTDGITTNSLPKTLQDAIKYTSLLGMKYIWIDALCIPQDDDYEKGLEIARMTLYYSRNTVTICAASAETCNSGFLHKRRPRFAAGPFEISVKTSKGMGSVLFYDMMKPDQPTTFRAWTLQESLLSRRLLVFGPDRLIWCCFAANAACGGPDGMMTSRTMGFPQSLIENVYPLTVLEMMPARRQWDKVVQDYTRRRLTNPTDKLLAVSAAASAIMSTARDRDETNSVYLAGLLADISDSRLMSDTLGWLTVHPNATRIQTYTAPSWSWACIDGAIASDPGYATLSTIGSFKGFEPFGHRFEVLDYEVTLVVAAAPYGAVSDGFIKIRGPVFSLNAFKDVRLIFDETPAGYSREAIKPGDCCFTIFPDTKDDKHLIEGHNKMGSGELCLLELTFLPGERGLISSGLILSRYHDDHQRYCRIGAFRYEANEKENDPIRQKVLLSPDVDREVVII